MGRSVVVTDNFNRASLGTDWSQIGQSTIQIQGSDTFRSGHDAAFPASPSGCARWVGAGTFSNDQYAEITVNALSNVGSNRLLGVHLRSGTDTFAGGSADLYYMAMAANGASGASHTMSVGKIVNGTHTQIATASVAVSNGDRVSGEVIGTAPTILRLYVNDTLVIDTTDSADAHTTGKPGVLSSLNGTTTNLGDLFEAGDVTADPVSGVFTVCIMG